jgi:hypothetical protein
MVVSSLPFEWSASQITIQITDNFVCFSGQHSNKGQNGGQKRLAI